MHQKFDIVLILSNIQNGRNVNNLIVFHLFQYQSDTFDTNKKSHLFLIFLNQIHHDFLKQLFHLVNLQSLKLILFILFILFIIIFASQLLQILFMLSLHPISIFLLILFIFVIILIIVIIIIKLINFITIKALLLKPSTIQDEVSIFPTIQLPHVCFRSSIYINFKCCLVLGLFPRIFAIPNPNYKN